MKENQIFLSVALVLVAVLSIAFGGLVFSDTNVVEKQVVVTKEVPVMVSVPTQNDTSDTLNKIADKILLEDPKESVAEALVLDEIETKDFSKALVELINEECIEGSVESYKDIEDIVVKDIETDVSGEDATVVVEFKVSYFLDGDSDSEDLEKAKVSVEFEVGDLDEDEDYEDAEVSDYELSLVKFYD